MQLILNIAVDIVMNYAEIGLKAFRLATYLIYMELMHLK